MECISQDGIALVEFCFPPCSNRKFQIRFTIRFSFRTESGSSCPQKHPEARRERKDVQSFASQVLLARAASSSKKVMLLYAMQMFDALCTWNDELLEDMIRYRT